jgi:hypothetical protein
MYEMIEHSVCVMKLGLISYKTAISAVRYLIHVTTKEL